MRAALNTGHARARAEADILNELTGFARIRMWQSWDAVDARDDFAARVGRREG